jgi:CheY-like chemotaxis protein
MTTILLVEDDEMNRDMIARHLKWEGFHVIVAGDGLQAISLVREERPDLILMDMGLPIVNGWQATTQIKADPATSAIPIIALTAFAMAEDRARSLAAGCNAYETKPINFSRLLTVIRQLLPTT